MIASLSHLRPRPLVVLTYMNLKKKIGKYPKITKKTVKNVRKIVKKRPNWPIMDSDQIPIKRHQVNVILHNFSLGILVWNISPRKQKEAKGGVPWMDFMVCSVQGSAGRGRLRGCGTGWASSTGSVPGRGRSRREGRCRTCADWIQLKIVIWNKNPNNERVARHSESEWDVIQSELNYK